MRTFIEFLENLKESEKSQTITILCATHSTDDIIKILRNKQNPLDPSQFYGKSVYSKMKKDFNNTEHLYNWLMKFDDYANYIDALTHNIKNCNCIIIPLNDYKKNIISNKEAEQARQLNNMFSNDLITKLKKKFPYANGFIALTGSKENLLKIKKEFIPSIEYSIKNCKQDINSFEWKDNATYFIDKLSLAVGKSGKIEYSINGKNLYIKNIGKWYIPDEYDDEEDFDFPIPTENTLTKISNIVKSIEKEFKIKIFWEYSEKYWMVFTYS